MDRGLSTFLGRPPRMIRRYITIDPPLDLACTDLIATPHVLAAAMARLDSHGWNTQGAYTRGSYARACFLMGSVREAVLEMSLDSNMGAGEGLGLEERIACVAPLPPHYRCVHLLLRINDRALINTTWWTRKQRDIRPCDPNPPFPPRIAVSRWHALGLRPVPRKRQGLPLPVYGLPL